MPADKRLAGDPVKPAVHIPEVIEPDEKLPPDLVALRRFAWLMDAAFQVPGTKWRFGVDAALGVIPGVGDIVGGLFSSWIIIGAVRHRVPMRVILRMVLNVAIDLIFGSVPLAGDLFDFLFEENVANMRLLEKHRDRSRPPRTHKQMAGVAFLVFGGVFLMSLLILGSVLALILWLIGQRL